MGICSDLGASWKKGKQLEASSCASLRKSQICSPNVGPPRSQLFPITLSVCVTSIEQPLRIPFCSATGHTRGAEKISLTSNSVSPPECPRSVILCLVLAGTCRSASTSCSADQPPYAQFWSSFPLRWPKACPDHLHSGCPQPWHYGHPHCALHHHE